MKKNVRLIVFAAALAVILAAGVAAQQSAETAVDPVCGMTVVKANAKATYDYKGTTYYFCNVGCKESFAKDPEKYIKAMAEGKPAGGMGMGMMPRGQAMGQGMGQGMMANCPMMQGGQMGGMRLWGMGMRAGMLPRLFQLYGDKIEVAVENTKDGAMLKVTSKDPEVVKAIQVHMAEHMTMMKKMKEAAK